MESVACPLCSKSKEELLWTKDDARYVRCAQCGLVYENPRFTEEELKAFYSNEDYYISTDEKQSTSGYANYYTQCTEPLLLEYFSILERASRKTGEVKFLDIGSGPGGLVSMALSRGWHAVGLEISHWSVEEGKRKGLPILEGTLTDQKFPDHSFDVISMFDVLEHLPRPVQYVREIHRILKPAGVVVAETPNIAGFFARNVYTGNSDLVKPRAHICLYSPRTADRLFRTTTFSNVQIETFPYCRKYTLGHFKSLIASRIMPHQNPTQLTYNESLRICARK